MTISQQSGCGRPIKRRKESTNCLIDVQSVTVNGSTPPSPSPPGSTIVSQLACVLVAVCALACVSVAPGPALSDQLSMADSTRSSDDDPRPGLPGGRSAVHIHFQSGVVLRSLAIRVALLCKRGQIPVCPQEHTRGQIQYLRKVWPPIFWEIHWFGVLLKAGYWWWI